VIHTLEDSAAAAHRMLAAEPIRRAARKVCALLREVLRTRPSSLKHLGDTCRSARSSTKHPDLGFCILAHVNHGAKESQPHDHGKYWRSTARPRRDGHERLAARRARAGRHAGQGRHLRAYLARARWRSSTTRVTSTRRGAMGPRG